VRRKYNWGGGQAPVEEQEEQHGESNHPMQREIVDVASMHKEVFRRHIHLTACGAAIVE
jgi:hypothetical protein